MRFSCLGSQRAPLLCSANVTVPPRTASDGHPRDDGAEPHAEVAPDAPQLRRDDEHGRKHFQLLPHCSALIQRSLTKSKYVLALFRTCPMQTSRS